MNKQRPTPFYAFEGTTFEVDIENQRLIERGNPENTISFTVDMADRETHYELAYDLGTRSALDRKVDFYDYDNWTHVKIPRLTELDPEGMAERYGYTIAELAGKTDYEVMVNQELLNERLTGKLPEIDIAGQKYIVDVRLKELRPVQPGITVINLMKLDIGPGEDTYTCYYHTVEHRVCDIDPDVTSLPAAIVQAEIPTMGRLDPVGVAREFGIEQRDFLRAYPIVANTAKITPLSATGLPALIERNLQKQRLEHGQNVRRIQPRQRPKF